MWDDLEALGINRRSEGVQNLLDNLRKNIQEATEDVQQTTAFELQARQELTPTAAARGIEGAPSPADEIQQALEQRAIDEAGLSTVERAELRVEEAVAINTAIDSGQKIPRPPKSAGLSGFNREMLIEIARQEGRDITKPDWWADMDKVLIRAFRKEHPPAGARGRARTEAKAAERLARDQLEQAHIDAGKSHDAAVKATNDPIPDKTLKTPVKDPTVTSLLPQDLRGSKPRYQDQQIEFEDDLDKALYIVAATKPSLGEPKFLKWINDVTGLDTVQAKAQGKLIRAEIKKLYTGDQETPIFLKSTVTRPKIKPPVPKPIPTQVRLTIGDDVVMNGVDSFLADSQSVKGFRYEQYSSITETNLRSTIRVINESTGEIITDSQFDSIDEAMTAYDDMVQAAHKPGGGGAEVPPTTETGGIDSFPPDGPPPVNAAGEPFSEDPEDIIAWFKRFLEDPVRVEEWNLTLEWRRRAQTGRIIEAREYEASLIAGGMEPGEAALKSRESLTGTFTRPQISMSLQEIAGPEVRTALQNKIAYFFREGGPNPEYFEMAAFKR